MHATLDKKLLQYSIEEMDNIVNNEIGKGNNGFSFEKPSETTFALVDAHNAVEMINRSVDRFYSKAAKYNHLRNRDYSYTQIGNFDLSINNCLEIGYDIFMSIGSSFVGLIIVDENRNKFNLLHPYNARRLIVNNVDLDFEQYSCLVVSDNESCEFTLSNYQLYKNTVYECIAIKDNATTENRLYTKISTSLTKPSEIVDTTYISLYTDENGRPTYASQAFMFSPAHLGSSKGIVFPYYGYTIGYDGKAWNLGPIVHPNISSLGDNVDLYHVAIEEDGYGNSEITVNDDALYGICTHSGAAYSIEGFSALNYANFDSALNSRTYPVDYALWSSINIAVSFEIFGRETVDNLLSAIDMKPESLVIKDVDSFLANCGATDVPDDVMSELVALIAAAKISSGFADEVVATDYPELNKMVTIVKPTKEEDVA